MLTPLGRKQRLLIVDRIGPGDNLEEYVFTEATEEISGGWAGHGTGRLPHD